ncbi:MAG: hypothetical protein ACYDAQ_00705 [Mycobacteriales bacterium]
MTIRFRVWWVGAQLLQIALEGEITVFLGRHRYARVTALTEDTRPGMRNGYGLPVRIKTTAGPVELRRPTLRDTTEAFASQMFGTGITRTNVLEAKAALLDLDCAREQYLPPSAPQPVPTWTHHHGAVAVQHRPRSLVGAKLHLALYLRRGDTDLVPDQTPPDRAAAFGTAEPVRPAQPVQALPVLIEPGPKLGIRAWQPIPLGSSPRSNQST